jgi:hypothetical protein
MRLDIMPGLQGEDSDPLFQTRLMKRTQRFTLSITGGAETGFLRIVRHWIRSGHEHSFSELDLPGTPIL